MEVNPSNEITHENAAGAKVDIRHASLDLPCGVV